MSADHPSEQSPRRATNRQVKVLRFLGVPNPESLSAADASFEITDLWQDGRLEERWNKYVLLTGDLDDATDQLRPFDEAALERVVIPEDWNRHAAERDFREALAASLLLDASPFNNPTPAVTFEDRTFVFTGRFALGSREQCEAITRERSGHCADSVDASVDYLVVGAKGNLNWKHGAYGTKIETAVLARRAHRRPAIVSEAHWRAALGVRGAESFALGPAAEGQAARMTEVAQQVARERTPVDKRRRRPSTVRFVGGYAEGWHMAVHQSFKAALDIVRTARTVDGEATYIETEGLPPCYSFSKGDTLYDTPLAYRRWDEALKHVGIAVTVDEGWADEPQGGGKADGMISVRFYRPSSTRDKLELAATCRITQSAFVDFLRTGFLPENYPTGNTVPF